MLLGVVALSRVPAAYLAKRMVVETPFLLFAVADPVRRRGPARRPRSGSASPSPGSSPPGGSLVKGTLGVLASLTMAATTEPQEVLVGLRRLRMPDLIVQIMGFMLRYLDVVTAELGRMTTAMRVARLRPALAAALAGARPLPGRAVHPLLRARRAGPPGHARRGGTTARCPAEHARGRDPTEHGAR